jgi:hypothetical protein
MNKILRISLLLSCFLAAQAASAQTDFKFAKTDYVGALSNNASDDWTQGWANWDPKSTAYPSATDLTTLDGMASSLPTPGEKKISGTLTLDATKTYALKGLIVVPSGAKLVIPAGTVIRAQADLSTTPKNYASIVVERGGQIEILGTQSSPVVITSAKAAGQRERGDWGGLVISGRGRHNLANANFDNVQMEGFNNISFDPVLAKFGGNDNNDNSGEIHYLRLEFGGLPFETNKEINGLTLGAVGAATEIDHVQVSFCNDDSFEWFGGAVNSKYLIAFKGTDDDFDTDNGYSGLNQFGIAIRDSAYFDLTYSLSSGASTSEGFESDNEPTGTASVQPPTNAVFSNYTLLGPVPVGTTYSQLNSTARSAFRRGARIRRNSSLRICNSIFMGYRNFLMVDGDSCVRNTNFPQALALVNPSTPVNQQTKQIFFANNLIVSTSSAFTSTSDTTANGLCEVARAAGSLNKRNAIDAWLRQTGCLANNIDPVPFTAGTVLVNPLAASTTPDFKPVAGSPALSGAEFDCNPLLANLSTSTEEVKMAKLNPIYPNPIRGGILNFGREVLSFGIFDANGNLLRYGLDTNHVSVDGLAPGLYFIKLDGQLQKLIVQ